jgi:hypothetical protein
MVGINTLDMHEPCCTTFYNRHIAREDEAVSRIKLWLYPWQKNTNAEGHHFEVLCTGFGLYQTALIDTARDRFLLSSVKYEMENLYQVRA